MTTLKQKTVSLLAVGTELTSGQIINRNASWISARLAQMGIQSSGHWTVPDDRPLIREALDIATRTSELIFVTGGLGPTTDDFTRELISEWTERPLEWHEASWTHIQERLGSRGMRVTEIQKQQCYYPQGSQVLFNSQGTANGFLLNAKEKTWVVLPGPPREIEAIWQDHLQAWLPSQFPNLDPWITRIWDTLGQGESVIAQLTEEALIGCSFEKGYRVHLPFVEVKLSFAKSQEQEAHAWIEKVTQALHPYTVLRDGQNSAEMLAKALEKFPRLVVCDQVSGEYLSGRLNPFARDLWRHKKVTFSNHANDVNTQDLVLTLEHVSNRQARACLRLGTLRRSEILTSPFQAILMQERERQVFAELAMLFWLRELQRM